MDVINYICILIVLSAKGETGGHEEKHHDHLKLYVPEFHHHDFHTKVVTIHHHHHKPKKEHHHHHHHHHKPHIPVVPTHHYNHKTHTIKTTTNKKHHGHHGHHGHQGHHGHHGHHNLHGHHHHHHGNHGHHGHHHGHHDHEPHDIPTVEYDPKSTFEEDFSFFTPSVPSYSGLSPQGPHISDFHHTPRGTGVQHTVKQVKVFDSLPGAIPNGYEVTEEGEEDEDAFTSINSVQQSFPGTLGFIQAAAAPADSNDPFTGLIGDQSWKTNNYDPFSGPPQQSTHTHNTAINTHDPFASIPEKDTENLGENFVGYQDTSGGFEGGNSFAGTNVGDKTYLANDDGTVQDAIPVSFTRVAGVQETIKTGGIESVTY